MFIKSGMIQSAIVHKVELNLLIALPLFLLSLSAAATEKVPSALDRGFRDLYDLNFAQAQR